MAVLIVLTCTPKTPVKWEKHEQRIYALNAWREPSFSREERAILALTEEVTLISHHVSDATYTEAIEVLGEQLTAQVMMAAVAVNSWKQDRYRYRFNAPH